MFNKRCIVLFSFCISTIWCKNETETIQVAEDSYLVAYKDAKTLNGVVKKITNRQYDVGNGPYPAPVNYGPDYNYGPPKPIYGPPSYPPPSYGPPNYYPPPEPTNGLPHALIEGLLDKFKLKLDLFTLAKILLKLILFKKLVSFIAVICLFLFIPWLKREKVDEKSSKDELRKSSEQSDSIDRITTFVWEAIDKYRSQNDNVENANVECQSIYCRAQKMIEEIYDSISFERLWNMYKEEL